MFVVPDVLAVHDIPSVEVRRVPDPPPVTKSSFPYMTLLRLFVVPEVLEVHEVPLSDEVSMVPELPTATNETIEVVVVVLSVLEVAAVLLSSDFAHEEISAVMLTIRKNQDNVFFTLFLYRKFCKIKTTQSHITPIGLFYKNMGKILEIV